MLPEFTVRVPVKSESEAVRVEPEPETVTSFAIEPPEATVTLPLTVVEPEPDTAEDRDCWCLIMTEYRSLIFLPPRHFEGSLSPRRIYHIQRSLFLR